MENKKDNCVSLNIYVNCNKSKDYESQNLDNTCSKSNPEKKENENCIEINVFVECDKKKCGHYTI